MISERYKNIVTYIFLVDVELLNEYGKRANDFITVISELLLSHLTIIE